MPQYNDYPLAECAGALEPLLKRGIDFHQKWTCSHCRSRQTMAEKNILFTSGICEQCGKESSINRCNYLIIGSGTAVLPILRDKGG